MSTDNNVIKIVSRYDSARVLWEGEAESVKDAVERATASYANLRYADLSGTDLRGADLRYADLSGAYLAGANLCRADLREASLCGANLNGACLSGADLSGADLYVTCADNVVGVDLLVLGGGRHRIVCHGRGPEASVQIGCQKRPLSYWLEQGRSIGEEYGYSENDMRSYGILLRALYAIVGEGSEQ